MIPRFSVIIPNYNHGIFLEQRIESILQQTFRDFEIIILDDCSTDNSRQVIENYRNDSRISQIRYNDKNSGSPFAQWKKGIELAKAGWIWIAESDDMADPHFLEEAVKSFDQFPSAGLFYCDGIIQNDDKVMPGTTFSEAKNHIFKTQKWSSSYFQKGITELNGYLKLDNTINNTSGVVFQKKILDAIDEKFNLFRYYGDWYLYIQLSLVTDICYSGNPLNIYRKHQKSLLNSPLSVLTSRKEYFLILQLLYYRKEVTDKKLLLDHFSFHFLNLGLFSHSPGNSYNIIKTYFQIDKKLARKVIPRLMLMKIFRKLYRNRVRQIEYIENELLPGR